MTTSLAHLSTLAVHHPQPCQLPIPGPELFAHGVLSGTSPAVDRLRLKIARIAPHFRTALILGQPGTGTLTTALYLHSLACLPASPVLIHSLLEPLPARVPATGTIFFTHLEQLPRPLQPAVLNFLSRLPRPVRILIVSPVSPGAMSAAGRLSAELCTRLAHVELSVPTLKDRMQDFDILLAGMLGLLNSDATFTAQALATLKAHSWPGNLAELHTLVTAVRHLRKVHVEDLPSLNAAPCPPTTQRLDQVMRRHVSDVLMHCYGNKLKAAELLGISRSTLYRMLENTPT